LRSLLYPIDNCKFVTQQIKIGWISKPETYNSCSFASIHLQIAETPRFLQSHLLHYGIHSTANSIQLLWMLDFGLWPNYSLKSFRVSSGGLPMNQISQCSISLMNW
jgi:hypothetical protein